MDRKEFIKTCCYTAIGLPFAASFLEACGGLYYAEYTPKKERLIVSKSEFTLEKRGKKKERKFVLIDPEKAGFPICIYKTGEDSYTAALLRCTHRDCELNVGGGIYSCPCHGSEFSMTGKLLSGPADRDLLTFETHTDHENIYILLA